MYDNLSYFQKAQDWNFTVNHSSAIFRILLDEKGAFLHVEDPDGQPFNFSSSRFEGPEQDLLYAIQVIVHRNQLQVDWANPNKRLYLHENEHLIFQLKKGLNIFGPDGEAISLFEDDVFSKAEMVVRFKENNLHDPIAHSELIVLVRHSGRSHTEFTILSERFVLIEKRILSIPPLGPSFRYIMALHAPLLNRDLEAILSILFSHFSQFVFEWDDWSVFTGNPRQVDMGLFIDRIDSDKNLYLRVEHLIEGLPGSFLSRYDVRRLVQLNEMERKMTIHDLHYPSHSEVLDDLESRLKKNQRSEKIKNGFFIEGNEIIVTDQLAKAFILNDFTALLFRYRIFGSEKLQDYKISTKQPKLNLSLSHGLNFLEGSCDLDFSGEKIPLARVLSLFKEHAFVPLSDGQLVLLNEGYIKKLQRIFTLKQKNVQISFFDLPELDELIEERALEKAPQKIQDFFSEFNAIADLPLSCPRIHGKARPYQTFGFKWMSFLMKHDLGPVLADEMGLGKTLQAIMVLASHYPRTRKPSLIVMPRTLLFNWREEIQKFCPRLSVYTYHGTQRNAEEIQKHHIALTTYGTVRNDIKTLKDLSFHLLILDESQKIKNLQSKATKAVLALKSEKRLALSGTPIENNLGELYALFRFLNPGLFGSLRDFEAQFANPIQRDQDHEASAHLKRKIFPFILRRLKKDVIHDLPEKVEQTLMVEMSPEQAILYEERRSFYEDAVHNQIQHAGFQKSHFYIFQALNELRQIATQPEAQSDGMIPSPKRQLLLEYIEDLAASGKKALVFSNFLRTIDDVSSDLKNSGIGHLILTGATQDRETLVRQFQEQNQFKVFAMTLKTGGVGLNLTAAEYIFIMDPWWNRAVENQAIDRTHRIGQKNTVFSYRLITKDTIEEKILLLQEMKKDLFEELISADSGGLKKLTEEDLGFLLGR